MRSWRWYSKLLFALLVAAFAYFVWPTQWRGFHAAFSPNSDSVHLTLMVRENRFTGRVQCRFLPGSTRWADSDAPHDYAAEEEAKARVQSDPELAAIARGIDPELAAIAYRIRAQRGAVARKKPAQRRGKPTAKPRP